MPSTRKAIRACPVQILPKYQGLLRTLLGHLLDTPIMEVSWFLILNPTFPEKINCGCSNITPFSRENVLYANRKSPALMPISTAIAVAGSTIRFRCWGGDRLISTLVSHTFKNCQHLIDNAVCVLYTITGRKPYNRDTMLEENPILGIITRHLGGHRMVSPIHFQG